MDNRVNTAMLAIMNHSANMYGCKEPQHALDILAKHGVYVAIHAGFGEHVEKSKGVIHEHNVIEKGDKIA